MELCCELGGGDSGVTSGFFQSLRHSSLDSVPPVSVTEIVEFPQMDVGAHGGPLEHGQKLVPVGFDDHFRQDGNQRAVFGGGPPSLPGDFRFGGHQGFQGLRPGTGGRTGIATGQVRFGDLEVQCGLPQGLVFREDDLFGSVPIGDAQAGTLSGFGVHDVKSVTPRAASYETVSAFLHTLFRQSKA